MKRYPDHDYTEQELAMYRQKDRDERQAIKDKEREEKNEIQKALDILRYRV